ncbi:MAG: hypothetical protein V4505_11850 [Pseudomonadota bacterium]
MSNWLEPLLANRFVNRVLYKAAFGLVLLLCLAATAAQAIVAVLHPHQDGTATSTAHEWPSSWEGTPLRPLALSPVERRFAEQFPGAIARLTDGRQMLVLRHVTAPTRMLHPAADCYRALGWRIEQARLEQDAQQRRWRCFTAQRAGAAPLRVCERIVDAQGSAFTDTSAWYWAAALGRSPGPWQAITTATTASTADAPVDGGRQ